MKYRPSSGILHRDPVGVDLFNFLVDYEKLSMSSKILFLNNKEKEPLNWLPPLLLLDDGNLNHFHL